MPFKHHAARRHLIPKARYRIWNWPAYEAGLKRRGDLTLWLDEAAIAGWQAPRRSTPGGQARYSDVAIELVLILRLVFHLALRPAEGFTASVLRLLGQALRVPDHTTVSRRSRGFAGRRPKTVPHGPLHLVIDSTGLKLFGQGEWDEEKHGRVRRSWRKLHLAVDADTGEIVASVLTENGADDAGQVPALLEQAEG
jgi:Transposase DDE domain